MSEDEIIERYVKKCGPCNQNTLLPYSYEWTCISCGFNLIKGKHELSKIHRKKLNFVQRIKFAEQKLFCICIHVFKLYEGKDYDKI